MKIKSFTHRGLKRLNEIDSTRGVPAQSANKLRNMLAFMEAMEQPEELMMPVLKWKAHPLSGDRKGDWALHVTANWRLTFRVNANEELCDLDLEDYH
jgi:proteic killer suppression protein